MEEKYAGRRGIPEAADVGKTASASQNRDAPHVVLK
jgi:hypothetical protein